MNEYNGLRIFVADKSHSRRELYRRCLVSMGFENIELFEKEKKLLNGLNKKPDVIFLDDNIMCCDLINDLRKIKQLSPNTYLVYISELHNMHFAFQALQSGLIDYIIEGNKDRIACSAVMQVMSIVSAITYAVAC